jgi:RimJ/RimL family protein N-acetyltransferase
MSQELSQELAKSIIGTGRLILRPLRESDAAAIFALFNDWNVMRWLSAPPWPYTRADAENYVRAALDPASETAETAFAITLHDQLIGLIGLRRRPASNLQSEAGLNIGYWLGTPYWRHGYMTEALRALVNHVFALTPSDALFCGAFAENRASLRVQEKAGFMHAGETVLFSRPNGRELAHVNTVLTRASLEFLAA